MQRGHIKRVGNCWMLRYNEKVVDPTTGKAEWKSTARKIATYSRQYQTEASVRPLADEFLAPTNAHTTRPESRDTVQDFIEKIYLPHCSAALRPSTCKGYGDLYKLVRPYLNGIRLRDFRTSDADRILQAVADSKPRAHTTLRNIKNLLSSVFRFAKRTDAVNENPVRDSAIPRGKPAGETHAYTLDEIQEMLRILDEPARTAVLVAALTGLRHSEIRGLRWTDFNGDELLVQRGVWNGHVSETKTLTSRATVPVLPIVKQALEEHKARNTGDGYVFHGATGQPLVLANVARREIIPALERAGLEWHGWHAFRRGLATNLYQLGAPDKTIQAILRHAQVSTTMAYYTKARPEDSQQAMAKLAAALLRKSGKRRERTA